ncbi:MAG: hypothetical protein JOY94_16840 [Methylobacteriaceae bacterium]|nr:hypothetical protein [Methylobacteriaceae bacterium]
MRQPAILHANPAAVRQLVIVRPLGHPEPSKTVGQPFLFAANGGSYPTERKRMPEMLFKTQSGLEFDTVATIDLGEPGIPENEAILLVENSHRFRKGFDGIAQVNVVLAIVPSAHRRTQVPYCKIAPMTCGAHFLDARHADRAQRRAKALGKR